MFLLSMNVIEVRNIFVCITIKRALNNTDVVFSTHPSAGKIPLQSQQ